MFLEEKKEGIYFKLFDMDKYREQRVAEGKDFMIDLDFDFLKISIDEDKAKRLNLDKASIASAVYSAFSQNEVSVFENENGKEYAEQR